VWVNTGGVLRTCSSIVCQSNSNCPPQTLPLRDSPKALACLHTYNHRSPAVPWKTHGRHQQGNRTRSRHPCSHGWAEIPLCERRRIIPQTITNRISERERGQRCCQPAVAVGFVSTIDGATLSRCGGIVEVRRPPNACTRTSTQALVTGK
jgi:hypothetical protein